VDRVTPGASVVGEILPVVPESVVMVITTFLIRYRFAGSETEDEDESTSVKGKVDGFNAVDVLPAAP